MSQKRVIHTLPLFNGTGIRSLSSTVPGTVPDPSRAKKTVWAGGREQLPRLSLHPALFLKARRYRSGWSVSTSVQLGI